MRSVARSGRPGDNVMEGHLKDARSGWQREGMRSSWRQRAASDDAEAVWPQKTGLVSLTVVCQCGCAFVFFAAVFAGVWGV